MNLYLIKLLSLFKPIYVWQKINYDQLKSIVSIKLEMDNRRTSGINAGRNATENSYAFTLSLFFFFIVSVFLAAAIGFMPSKLFAFTIYHAYVMVMITLTLIGDFSFVLLDTSDNTIISPRPIDTKTFYAARTTHILLYIFQIGVALALIPCVVTFFVHGIMVGLVCIVTTCLTVFLSVSLTNGLYLLLMRLFSEERLKNIINYFQIGMAIVFMGGYQILPRLFSLEIMENLSNSLPAWSVFIPPMWMGALIEWTTDFRVDTLYILCSVLAVTVPIIIWKINSKYLAPYFASKIADLGITSHTKKFNEEKTTRHKKLIFIGSDIQKSGYSIVSYALGRDRKLKLRYYPSIGYMIVLAIVFLSRSNDSNVSWINYILSLGDTQKHLTLIYIAIFILVTVSFEINITDEFKAAWVFFIAPIPKPGEVLVGAFKAIIARMFVPIYFIISIIVLLLWREKAILDLVFGFIVCISIMLVISNMGDKHFPQSLAMSERSHGTSMARAIISAIIIALTGYGHYMISKNTIYLIGAGVTLIVINYFLYKRYRNISWEQLS